MIENIVTHKEITLYDPLTGVISGTTSVQLPLGVTFATATKEQLFRAYQANVDATGLAYVVGTPSHVNQRVVDGQFEDIPLVSTPLSDIQDARWETMKRKRDLLEATAFPYMGKMLQSDERSVIRLNTSIQDAQIAQSTGREFEPIMWQCLDNTGLLLDMDGFLGIPAALKAYSLELFYIAQQLRGAIYEATTPEAVAAIHWPAPTTT